MSSQQSEGPQGRSWIDVTSGVGAGTKGDYEKLIGSTLFASTWMSFQVYCDGTNSDTLFDLATGQPGSEVIIVDDQLYHFRNTSGGSGRGNTFSFPMALDKGTRISVRVRDEEGGAIVHEHSLTISNFTPPLLASPTSDSSGKKTITNGELLTYGDWVELIPATTQQRGWMVVSLFGLTVDRQGELEIGTGIEGSELTIMKALAFQRSSQSGELGLTFSAYPYFPVNIPAGTRISGRIRQNNAGSDDYIVGVFVT